MVDYFVLYLLGETINNNNTIMRIEHIAIYANDIELLRAFYIEYFGFQCGNQYHNPAKNFTSYFLSFGDEETRIELMHVPGLPSPAGDRSHLKGLAHLAIAVGSREAVNALTERLRADGHTILSEPRLTGDGYYGRPRGEHRGNNGVNDTRKKSPYSQETCRAIEKPWVK